jgi:hypothetical protein
MEASLSAPWVPVLQHHPDGESTSPGYLCLDVNGRLLHVRAIELEVRDTSPETP